MSDASSTTRHRKEEAIEEATFPIDFASSARRPLSGRTCVVTGASRGIGRAIAIELAQLGGEVVVNYHSSPDAAEGVLERVEEADTTGITVQADVADVNEVESMAEAVHEELGSVDVLVNNAGINIDKRFADFDPADWQRVLRVNLEGAFNVTAAFYDDLAEADHGRVINISSVNGERGSYGQSNYSASKTGLIGFTLVILLMLVVYKLTGINAVVAPGYTRTDMVEGMREDIKDQIRDEVPLDRFADPQEIAYTVSFLATDRARYITGEVLNVNGGLYP